MFGTLTIRNNTMKKSRKENKLNMYETGVEM